MNTFMFTDFSEDQAEPNDLSEIIKYIDCSNLKWDFVCAYYYEEESKAYSDICPNGMSWDELVKFAAGIRFEEGVIAADLNKIDYKPSFPNETYTIFSEARERYEIVLSLADGWCWFVYSQNKDKVARLKERANIRIEE